jgi:hypothetical protein
MKKNFGYGRAGKWEELWLKRLKERLPEQVKVEGRNFTVLSIEVFGIWNRDVSRCGFWIRDPTLPEVSSVAKSWVIHCETLSSQAIEIA